MAAQTTTSMKNKKQKLYANIQFEAFQFNRRH